jgi:CRP-like cAMP-binding protein
VAQHLLSVCQERAVQDSGDCLVELTLTQGEIASRVGSTRESVSRAFSHLQQRGLIQLKGVRLLRVPDVRALIRFAGLTQQLEKAKHLPKLSSEIA